MDIMDQFMIKAMLSIYIDHLKRQQKENNLFLDLEEYKVRKRYRRTYPKGTCYNDFLHMICDMTSENNLNNEVVIKEMKDPLDCIKLDWCFKCGLLTR